MAKFPPDDDEAPPEPELKLHIPPAPSLGAGLAELDELKKIEQRTSGTTKIVLLATVAFIVVASVVGYFMYKKYSSRWDEWEQVRQLPLEQQPAKLRAILTHNDYQDVRQEIIAELAQMRDAESVPLFIEALDTPGIVRRQAAMALADIGSPRADVAKDKLLAVLPRTTDTDHLAVVWALAVLDEPRALDAILEEFGNGNLQMLDGFDPRVITRVVGRERLASMIHHQSAAVRLLVSQALSEVATGEVVEPLIAMLQDTDGEVVRQAAAGLGRTGDPRVGAPLLALLNQHPNMREGILDTIRKSTGAPGVAALAAVATDDRTKRDLATMLREMHDPRAANALAAMVASSDVQIRETAAFGLAELGDARSVAPLAQIMSDTSEEHEQVAVAAIKALGDLGDRSAQQPLLHLLDRFQYRRAVILQSLGMVGDPAVVGPVLDHAVSTDDSAVACRGLAQLRYEPSYQSIVTMATRPEQIDMAERSREHEDLLEDRTGAIRALGWYGRADAAETLMTIVEDPHDDVMLLRELAADELGSIATPAIAERILTKVLDPRTDAYARGVYLESFWRRPNPGIATRLVPLMSAPNSAEVRRSAAIAVGYGANPEAYPALHDMLGDAEGRRYAALAIILGGDDALARDLMRAFVDDGETLELVRQYITNEENDWFTNITEPMFESGSIWHRLRVCQVLRDGEATESGRPTHSYSWAWDQVIGRLEAGWEGPDGLGPRRVRTKLWEALRGSDADRRTLAAEVLGGMLERGLLLAARDLGGPGSEEARRVLRRINVTPEHPAGDTQASP